MNVEKLMPNYPEWTDQTAFRLNGFSFRIDTNFSPQHRRISTDQEFTIVKGRSHVQCYLDLASRRFTNILELGVFQGGSFVFFDQLFAPQKIVAVELSKTPVPALDRYVAGTAGRARVRYGTSQTDSEALEQIVADDFGGEVDLVIDDASHAYSFTKTSFLTLFPKLRPGGLYIIEDWAWSFQLPFQNPEHPWHAKPALANLIIEIMSEIGSTNLIPEMRITRNMAMIQKSDARIPLFSKRQFRGRELPML